MAANTNGESILEINKQFFLEKINADDEMIESTVMELIEAGIGQIKELNVDKQGSGGWILNFTDIDGQVYYLELNSYGGLSFISKDNINGEIIRAYLDDDDSDE